MNKLTTLLLAAIAAFTFGACAHKAGGKCGSCDSGSSSSCCASGVKAKGKKAGGSSCCH